MVASPAVVRAITGRAGRQGEDGLVFVGTEVIEKTLTPRCSGRTGIEARLGLESQGRRNSAQHRGYAELHPHDPKVYLRLVDR